MSGDDPERMRVVGATELERRLLAAAGAELPDPELRARMARAIGLAGVASTTAAAAASGGSTTAASALTWPVVSASIAALALTGAAIGYTSHRAEHEMPAEVAARPTPVAPEPPAAPPPAVTTAPPPARALAPALHPRRSAAVASVADLRGEIALLDAVRGAVAQGTDDRALALLRRYETRYPTGTLGPEATALRIEVLARLGQTRQAEALGAEFLAAHPDSPLAARVRRALGR